MTCCFIGHRKIEETPALREKVKAVVEELIESGTKEFLFGDHSRFNDLCYEVVTALKQTHSEVKRIHYRTNYPESGEAVKKFFLDGFEDSVCPPGVEKAGRAAYVERNQAMILASDVCVFYYSGNRLLEDRKAAGGGVSRSGTGLAYAFAVQKKKTVINLYPS